MEIIYPFNGYFEIANSPIMEPINCTLGQNSKKSFYSIEKRERGVKGFQAGLFTKFKLSEKYHY